MHNTPEQLMALILAGGFGTRLRSELPVTPKALAPISGQPFLFHQLKYYHSLGVKDVVLCTHYLSDQIERAVFENPVPGLNIQFSQEQRPLGTGGALRLAAEKTDASYTCFLCANGDSFSRFSLETFYKEHQENNACASILLTHVDDASRYGVVQVDENSRVLAFHEKQPQAYNANWINAGVYLIERDYLLSLPAGIPLSLEHDVLPKWAGDCLYANKGGGDFIDIGTPQSLKYAQESFPFPTV